MNNIKTFILIILVFSLISCNRDMSDLDEYFRVAKSTPASSIEPLPEINSPEVFLYEAEEMRDPFSNDLEILDDDMIEVDIESEGAGPDRTRRKEILENYPLDGLYMVGTYMQNDSSWGLIEDPEGVVHRVSVDQYLGQNYGQIITIKEDRVSVSEWVSDGLGGWVKREASIALREE